MLIGLGLGAGLLVYAAFVLDLCGFLTRDELWLRTLMLAGSGFYIAYLFLAAGVPLWDGIAAEAVLASVNMAMILVILGERSTYGMSDAALRLHAGLRLLSPGQIRRLVKVSVRVPAEASPEILTFGVRPERLYYLSEGAIELIKHGDTVELQGPMFLGEIAWLTGGPATATVRLRPGAVCLGWRHDDLRRLVDRRPAIGDGLSALLNADLAAKLALSRLGPSRDLAGALSAPAPAEDRVAP